MVKYVCLDCGHTQSIYVQKHFYREVTRCTECDHGLAVDQFIQIKYADLKRKPKGLFKRTILGKWVK